MSSVNCLYCIIGAFSNTICKSGVGDVGFGSKSPGSVEFESLPF